MQLTARRNKLFLAELQRHGILVGAYARLCT
jgi:hypothetical protein